MPRISSIVEGHGEVQALPVLLRRIAIEHNPPDGYEILRPIRVPRSTLLRPNELERAIALSALEGADGVLIVLDADDDCPAQLGPDLSTRAQSSSLQIASAVVVIKHEYEAFFLASASSLAGRRRLPIDIEGPSTPEGVRGAKEWLSARMPSNQPYRETLDQAALTEIMDLDLLRSRSPSFRKLDKEMRRLLGISRLAS